MRVKTKVLLNKIMVLIIALALVVSILPTASFFVGADNATNLLTNGDFENGTTGFSNAHNPTFEVITDPNDASNHILHVKGTGGGGYWQTVTVEKNTNYIWTFRMKDLGSTNNTKMYVYPASAWTDMIKSVEENSTQAYSALDTTNGGAYVSTYNQTWQTFTIKFNSGENTEVKLYHNMWTDNREVHMDDWTLVKDPTAVTPGGSGTSTALVNGDFENGTTGYSSSGTTTFEVIADPDNASNHILHVVGAGGYWQTVAVDKNTDYIWTFRMKDIGNTGTTRIFVYPVSSWTGMVTAVEENSTQAYSAFNTDGSASIATYDKTWQNFTIKFNSGDNTEVKLYHNMWAANREIHMDDWTLTKDPSSLTPDDDEPIVNVAIVNGDFENGVTGYTNTDTTVFETIVDPDNAENHILYYSGSESRGKGAVYQTVQVNKNTDYIWTFKFKNGENTRNDYTKVNISGQNWQAIESKISSETAICDQWGIKSKDKWSVIKVIFNSGDNTAVNLYTNAWASTNHVYFDDWTIAEYSYNTLENPSFEDGTEGYEAEGTTIAVDTANAHKGTNALKITGAGKVIKKAAVLPYCDTEWKFFFKSSASAGFAVSTVDGKLLPSSISTVKGSGTATPESLDADRTDGYHTVTSTNYTEYSVKFDSEGYTEVLLIYNSDSDITAYTDDWYLYGEKYYGDEEILNGDFETGHFGAYEKDSYIKDVKITDKGAHSGKYATVISKNETVGDGNFKQSVKVKKNSEYIWTFWMKFDATETPVGVTIGRQDGGAKIYNRIVGDCDAVVTPSVDWHRMRYADNNWHQYKIQLSTADAEMVDLILIAYAPNSVIVTDDWSLEYVGATPPKSNTLYEIGFESEKMGCQPITNPCWTVSDEEAHSGDYSVKYDAKSSKGPTDLLYLNENGIINDHAQLEQNSLYRFSFWYKGKGKLSMANIKLQVYSTGATNIYDSFYGCEDEEWNYCEYILETGTLTASRFQIMGTIVGSAAYTLYVDDIKLEKIVPGIINSTIDPETVTCDDKDNLIPEDSRAASMTDSQKFVKKLELTPYGVYNFAFSYKANGAVTLAGLSVDEYGNSLPNGEGVFILDDTNGATLRKAYTFVAPADGVVYLYLENLLGSVEISDAVLYSLLPESAPAKDKITIENNNKDTGSSIWDEEFEFDFDWNYDQGDFDFEDDEIEDEYYDDFEDFTDMEIIDEPEDDEEDEEVKSKKYMRVKKRSLISKGKPGVNVLAIVLIAVGAVVAAGAVAFLLIILNRRKKKLN